MKPLLVEYEEVLGLLNDLPDASRPHQLPQPSPEAEEVLLKATTTTTTTASEEPSAVATSEDKATPLNNSNGNRGNSDDNVGSLTSRAARKGWKNVFPFR